MKSINIITTGLVFSLVFSSCINNSLEEQPIRIVKEFGLIDYFEISNEWEVSKYKKIFDSHIEITIKEEYKDTTRLIELVISVDKEPLPYFNCDSFHYIEEKISYFDSESKYNEIILFFDDTLYHLRYDSDQNNSYVVNDYERIYFYNGEDHYRNRYDPPAWDDRVLFYLRGLWNFTPDDQNTFQARFNSDSVIIQCLSNNEILFHDLYALKDGKISISIGDDIDFEICKILPNTLEILYNDSIIFAKRTAYLSN